MHDHGRAHIRFAVLEVGGSHVTGAWVDLDEREPIGRSARLPLDSGAPAETILDTIATVGRKLDAPRDARWAVAFPGPFDYAAGIGRFTGVGKFDSLRDVDVRAALSGALDTPPHAFHFVNDADAFALGVWASGSGIGRLVCLTLGTGVGSAFVADGDCVTEGDTVPVDAEIHFSDWQGLPLEETVSHRAIVRAWAEVSGDTVPGVREVVELARAGDARAAEVLRTAFFALGAVAAYWVDRFGGTDLTFGGSMVAAWDLLEPPIRAGLATTLVSPMPHISVMADGERAGLIGGAFAASRALAAEAMADEVMRAKVAVVEPAGPTATT